MLILRLVYENRKNFPRLWGENSYTRNAHLRDTLCSQMQLLFRSQEIPVTGRVAVTGWEVLASHQGGEGARRRMSLGGRGSCRAVAFLVVKTTALRRTDARLFHSGCSHGPLPGVPGRGRKTELTLCWGSQESIPQTKTGAV